MCSKLACCGFWFLASQLFSFLLVCKQNWTVCPDHINELLPVSLDDAWIACVNRYLHLMFLCKCECMFADFWCLLNQVAIKMNDIACGNVCFNNMLFFQQHRCAKVYSKRALGIRRNQHCNV